MAKPNNCTDGKSSIYFLQFDGEKRVHTVFSKNIPNRNNDASNKVSSSSHRFSQQNNIQSQKYKPYTTRSVVPFLRQRRNECIYRIKQVLKDLFLPVGYPYSVNNGREYIQYQFYDSLQGLCSYLRGVVSTSAVLTAAGVGDSEATALSAAVQWATKDGCGMIGGLLFSYYTSSYFDSHVKEFRLFADIVNDIGLTLDMITPYVPKSYLLFVSVMATLCRTLCGISAGATKGSITQHFAIQSNMADLNAKEGTQETLVSLIGMVLGIILARMIQTMDEQCQILKGLSESKTNAVGGDTVTKAISSLFYTHGAFTATWLIFIVLTWVHVWANYVGVNTLRLKTLNRQRAEVVLGNITQTVSTFVVEQVETDPSNLTDEGLRKNVLKLLNNESSIRGGRMIISPDNCQENLFFSFWKMFVPGKLRLGVDLQSAFVGLTDEEIVYLAGVLFQNERYLISISSSIKSFTKINLVLHTEANDEDKLKAFVHGMIVEKCVEKINDRKGVNNTSMIHLVTRCKICVDLFFESKSLSVCNFLNYGWEGKMLLGFGEWQAEWTIK